MATHPHSPKAARAQTPWYKNHCARSAAICRRGVIPRVEYSSNANPARRKSRLSACNPDVSISSPKKTINIPEASFTACM